MSSSSFHSLDRSFDRGQECFDRFCHLPPGSCCTTTDRESKIIFLTSVSPKFIQSLPWKSFPPTFPLSTRSTRCAAHSNNHCPGLRSASHYQPETVGNVLSVYLIGIYEHTDVSVITLRFYAVFLDPECICSTEVIYMPIHTHINSRCMSDTRC